MLTGNNDPSEFAKWQQCLWVIPNLTSCLRGKGFPVAEPHDGDVFGLTEFPSRKYLENHIFWQSSSLERILIHHLLVWEAAQFGPSAIGTQLSIWDELAQIVAPAKFKQFDTDMLLISLADKSQTVNSLSKLGTVRKWTATVRTSLYLAIFSLLLVLMLVTGIDNEIVRQIAIWMIVPLSLGMIAWTIGSLFGWIIRPLVSRRSIKKQLQPLILLSNMSRLGDKFLKFTSPKEAEHEMIQTRADGAVWPNDCWALLYLSINRGDAFWGGELQNRPFYKSQLDEPLSKPKAKDDGLINLLKTLNGGGNVDENGNYYDYPSLDY